MKSPDLLGAFACFSCHQIVDGQKQLEHWTRDDIRLAFYEGHARTIRRWMEMGLVVLERGKVLA